MKMRWHHCESKELLPLPNKSRLCLFRIGPRVLLEVCTLLEDWENEGRFFWVIRGATTATEVFPFAWLEIDKEFPSEYLDLLASEGTLEVGN